MANFPCTCCGACCRRVGFVSQEILDSAGLEAKEDGSCTHLVNNQCSIYEERPEICRVDWNPLGLSQEANYKLTASVCNLWMDQDGVDPSLRVAL